tara:strand:+ start:673 stop:1116 length:444 start_codon:yes stop_codon:yes gene_type:complete
MKVNLKYLQILFRLIVGIVFIYASYDKILDPISFSKNIHNFHITPIFIENLAALIIPWLELIIGILLILGLFLEGTTTITIALLMFFIFILSQAVFRGIDVHCGCFKSEAEIATVDLRFQLIKRIVEDIILLIFTYFIRYFNKGKNV